VSAADFNWAAAIFVGVIVVAVTYYIAHGHKVYQGPVTLVKKM